MTILRETFISLNIIGSLLMASAMLYATPEASIKRAQHDPQAMWGMLRRLFYLSITGGMMGKALWTIGGAINPSVQDMVCWLMIVLPLGLFLLMRVLGFINQDRWQGVSRQSRRHNSGM